MILTDDEYDRQQSIHYWHCHDPLDPPAEGCVVCDDERGQIEADERAASAV